MLFRGSALAFSGLANFAGGWSTTLGLAGFSSGSWSCKTTLNSDLCTRMRPL
jgi:hypothetical protein